MKTSAFVRQPFIVLILFFFLPDSVGAQKLRVTPQWLPQAQFTGIYVAHAMGFYKDAGLEVEIVHPSATHSAQQMLKEGETDIIISQLIDAIILWDQNFKMVNVLQMSEKSSLLIVSRNPLDSPDDLKGKRIGHWKAGFSYLGFIFDDQRKLNAEWIPFHSNIALFVSGAIDATLAMEYNEYFQLQMAGRKLGPENVIAVRDYGLNVQEDGIYVTPDFLSARKEDVRKFVEATKQGWEWVRRKENRGRAIDIVMAELARNNVHSNRINQEYMLKTILRLQENEAGVAPYTLTEMRFNEAVSLMQQQGYILNSIPYADFVKPF